MPAPLQLPVDPARLPLALYRLTCAGACVTPSVAPVITLNGDSLVTLECGDVFVDSGASALDACDGPLSVSVDDDSAISGTTPLPGEYLLLYSATDSEGNIGMETRTVRVIDMNQEGALLIIGGHNDDRFFCLGGPWIREMRLMEATKIGGSCKGV